MRLESSIKELHAMFMDMAMLVETQVKAAFNPTKLLCNIPQENIFYFIYILQFNHNRHVVENPKDNISNRSK